MNIQTLLPLYLYKSRYLHSWRLGTFTQYSTLRRGEERGRQCWEVAKQELQCVNRQCLLATKLCYYPTALIVGLNSLKAKEEFLFLTTEGTAWLGENSVEAWQWMELTYVAFIDREKTKLEQVLGKRRKLADRRDISVQQVRALLSSRRVQGEVIGHRWQFELIVVSLVSAASNIRSQARLTTDNRVGNTLR